MTVLYFDRVGRNTIILEAWLARAGTSVKFPVMPRADNIFAIQPAFAERSACVIARIRKNTKCAIFIRNGEFSVQHGDALERRRRKLVDAADINPVLHGCIPFV